MGGRDGRGWYSGGGYVVNGCVVYYCCVDNRMKRRCFKYEYMGKRKDREKIGIVGFIYI